MTLELKTGMRIQIKDMQFTVEEVGPPEEIPTWRGYTGLDDGKLVESLQRSQVTRCACLAPDGYSQSLFIIQWRDYWWSAVGKIRLDGITVLTKPQ